MRFLSNTLKASTRSLAVFSLLITALFSSFTSAHSTSEPLTIKHSFGEISLDHMPKRVVVLGHGSLDLLDKLDIKPVGVVQSLLPDYLKQYEDSSFTNVGSAKEPNFETIYNLKPDLIIGEGRQSAVYDELVEIAPTYMFVIDSKDYWKTTQNHWRAIGQIFHKEEKVEALILETQTKIDALHAKAQAEPLKTLMVMNNGNKLSMFAEQSRFSVLFDEFGLMPDDKEKGAVSSNHGNLISFEYIANANPDAILILDREQAIGRSSGKAKTLFDNKLIEGTTAYKNDRIIFIDGNAWYLTAGGVTATEQMISDTSAIFGK